METELTRLLKLAQGDRSLNAFARHADVSPGNLSRIMNGQRATPQILKKLSTKALNNVTYEQLMKAAGYINNDVIENPVEDSEPKKTLEESIIELMIKYGIIKDKDSVNEKHLEFIKFAIEEYRNEKNDDK